MDSKTLQPHQVRVIEENEELENKLSNLRLFIKHSDIFKSLPIEEKDDLIDQAETMKRYNEILKRRIARFYV